MKLTTRFIITLLVVTLPLSTAFTVWRLGVENQRAHEDRVEQLFARAAPRIARQCAIQTGEMKPPRRFRRPDRRRPSADGELLLGRRARGVRAYAYDENFQGNAQAPAVPGPIQRALRDAEVAHMHSAVGEADRASAFRLEETGPCSVVVLYWNPPEGTGGPGAAARRVVVTQSLALVVALILTGLLVGLPLVRRIRRLTHAVEESPNDRSPLDESRELNSKDELGDLARAYRDALDRINDKIRELQERDEALEAYIGNTTHDLAIPLTVVQHRLRKLQKRVDGDDRKLVDQTLEESSYIAALIANMAAAARLEAGEAHLTFHDVDVAEVVQRVASRIQPIASAKGVNFNFAVPPDSITTKGDSTLIEQALSNVVQNAVQYVGEGGNVVLLLEPEGSGFRIEVFDDGPGIEQEMLAKVLERSVRGDNVRTRNEGGSGFGLAIVREVVVQHGWKLDLSNREEGGLRVVFRSA